MDRNSGGKTARPSPGAPVTSVLSLEALLDNLTSGEEARAEAAAASLIELGTSTLPRLQSLLDSPESDHRWWAIRTLAGMETAETGWFVPFLSDPVDEIRQCAALALAAHPGPEAVPALCQALSDPDSLTARLVAAALAAHGSEAAPALLEVQKDAPLAVRIQAMRALSQIADPRAIPAMMSAFEEDSAILQHWAETGLERLGLDTIYLKPE